jgi:small conductance mechanosensitive channel
MDATIEKIVELLTVYGLRIIAALAIFILGRWVAKGVRKLLERGMKRNEVDVTLISFVSNLVYIGLLAFIVIAALGQLGIQTTSFIAILGAAGLAVGLACRVRCRISPRVSC